jgi:hypothetical protein
LPRLAHDLADLVGFAEIVQRSGRPTQTVATWRRRPDFPKPVLSLAAGPVWSWREVEAWIRLPRLAGRPPRNRVDEAEHHDPSASEVGWAAGHFDAGGNVTISGGSLKAQVHRSSAPGSPPPPELTRFASIVGTGKISSGQYGDRRPEMETRRPRYQWYAYNDEAVAMLKLLWPSLGPTKRAQANAKLQEVGRQPIDPS